MIGTDFWQIPSYSIFCHTLPHSHDVLTCCNKLHGIHPMPFGYKVLLRRFRLHLLAKGVSVRVSHSEFFFHISSPTTNMCCVSSFTFILYIYNLSTYILMQFIPSFRNKLHLSSYIDPSRLITETTVFQSNLISIPTFHSLIYSVSSFTTSSKSVISLLPLTCHIPVIPGLIASLAL